jgi:hypothetical protein
MWIAIGIAIGIVIVALLVFLFFLRFNNFVLIARNLTYIHEILRNEYKERFPDEDILLITCGVIDTRSYNFPLEDMKLALRRSKEGECFLEESLNQLRPRNFFSLLCTRDLFLNFVLELELMRFLKDSSLRRENILTSIVSSKEKIEKTIDRAKRSYARGKRPLLWRRAISNFMTSFTLEEIRDQIGIIRPTPEQQLDLLFQALIKRKHWKDIDPEIIQNIFNNAKGDVDAIKRFIFISEIHNSVGNNFVKIASDVSKTDVSDVISMFAVTLYRLGSDLIKALPFAKTEDEVSSLSTRAEMAFTSSLLCNPFDLESYFGLALLFSETDKDVALEWCAKYKEAEGKLLNTPDEELNISQLNRKKLLDPEEHHKTLIEISEKSKYLHFDETEVDGIPSIREMIAELEAELMQRA